jgi:UDP-2,3-diacylglucosamine pyrophosphatase LpxH
MANDLINIPKDSFPYFDELFVISDLHLGGPKDFQIFNSTFELKKFIDYLCDLSIERHVALLINGDFIDFLAQAPEKAFEPEKAIKKLQKIADDPTFSPVFESLRGFTNKPNRKLIVNIGNHDLELALPWVSDYLLRILASDEASRGRIILSLDGTGFRCRVGNAAVLCVHGNEVDAWNVADFESIRRLSREITQGRPINDWVPNGGSYLVVDVMNDLKVKFPFIDLLKPGTRALYPTLLAVAPEMNEMKGKLDKIRPITMSFGYKILDYARLKTGKLGDEEPDLNERSDISVNMLSRHGFKMTMDPTSSNGKGHLIEYPDKSVLNQRILAEILLDEAETNFKNDVDPFSLVAEQHDDSLGRSPFDKVKDLFFTVGDMIRSTSKILNIFSGKDISQRLFEALSDLKQDRSFDPGTPDSTFELLDSQIGSDIDFLIAGHTHFERALKRENGSGWYFNSGTWTRLIQLDDFLTDLEEFRKLYGVLEHGSMIELDAYKKDADKTLVKHKLTVIAIREKNGQTDGELLRVKLPQTEGDIPLKSPKDLNPKEPEYIFTKKN